MLKERSWDVCEVLDILPGLLLLVLSAVLRLFIAGGAMRMGHKAEQRRPSVEGFGRHRGG